MSTGRVAGAVAYPPAVPPARRVDASLVAQAAGALGGVLLLGAALLPWSRRGAGSTIALREVADLVLSGTVDAWAPRWAGLVVYAVPLGGALLLVGAGLGGRAGLATTCGGLAAAVGGTALAAVALARLDRTALGGGTLVAVAGAILGVLAVAAGLRAGSHRSRPPDRGDVRP